MQSQVLQNPLTVLPIKNYCAFKTKTSPNIIHILLSNVQSLYERICIVIFLRLTIRIPQSLREVETCLRNRIFHNKTP